MIRRGARINGKAIPDGLFQENHTHVLSYLPVEISNEERHCQSSALVFGDTNGSIEAVLFEGDPRSGTTSPIDRSDETGTSFGKGLKVSMVQVIKSSRMMQISVLSIMIW